MKRWFEREKFQAFVKEKCEIPEESFGRITQVYRDFFNRFSLELGGRIHHGRDCAWNSNWTIFTTACMLGCMRRFICLCAVSV
jgi:hypothetical protein